MADNLTVKIEKRFPSGATVVAELEVPQSPPSVTVLFGPSGSGKTTLLRCLAGLEQPDRGFIYHDQKIWYDRHSRISLSPQQRHIGFLFQEYALFPHKTVLGNLEYGLSNCRREQRAERAAQLINLFQLNGIEGRFPRQLSGGQLQKVALARTLAPQPRLLLLDEPLSALDDPTRSRLRSELRRLLIQVGIPTLLVTHDRLEAIALGDRLVVMVDGQIQQTGPVREVFSFPANHAVAQSVGTETLVPGEITETRNGLLTVQAGQVQITSVDPGDLGGREVYLCIRAEDVIVERGPTSRDSARNHLSGHITSIIFEGVLVKVMLDCGIPLCALVTRQSCEELNLKDGDNVTAIVKATAIHLVPRTSAPGNG